LPFCIEVPVPSQESVQWYIYVRGIDFVSFSDFSTVFLEAFWQWGSLWQLNDMRHSFPFLYLGLILWPTGTTWHSESIHWSIKLVDGHPFLRCRGVSILSLSPIFLLFFWKRSDSEVVFVVHYILFILCVWINSRPCIDENAMHINVQDNILQYLIKYI
jgi:hypothetical protein